MLQEELVVKNGLAEVRVSKTLAANTLIQGPHASLTITEDLHRVLIRETRVTDPDGETTWKIAVSNL